jgi:ribosomal protein L7/L12
MDTEAVIFVAFVVIALTLAFGVRIVLADIEARMAIIHRIECKIDLILQHAAIRFDPYANVPPEVAAAVQQKRKIKAITLYRRKTGTGLKEAKEFIEELQRRAGVG